MTDPIRGSAVRIPPELFLDYLKDAGLGARFRLLLTRARETRRTFEGSCDASLEIEGLLCRSPPSEGFRDSLRTLLEPLGSDLVLRIPRADLGSGEADLLPVSSRAEVLDALRRAWAGSWAPAAIRAGAPPDLPPVLEALPAAALPRGRGNGSVRRKERAPDGTILEADPEGLGRALDSAEAFLSAARAAGPGALEGARERLVLVRCLAGSLYGRSVPPGDTFGFLALPGSPDPGLQNLLGLVRRSFGIEEQLVRAAGREAGGAEPADAAQGAVRLSGPEARPADGSRAQQLTGTPSSPGRASGVAFRPGHPRPAGGRTGAGEGRLAVLLCDRLTRSMLETFPDAAAAVERDGGRIGLGAHLARSARLPCVSGIRDLDRIPEGTRIRIDGDLGLLSLESPG